MTSLTPRNLEVLRWIQNFYKKYQFSPTLREIQKGLGFKSIAPVQNHIQRLKAANFLVSDPTKARTLRLVQTTTPLLTTSQHPVQEVLIDHIDP